jgi:hypothetical protein
LLFKLWTLWEHIPWPWVLLCSSGKKAMKLMGMMLWLVNVVRLLKRRKDLCPY